MQISEKATITIKEAAEYTGIGTKKLYEMTNDPMCPFVIFNGNRRLIKRKLFVNYLERVRDI